MTTVATTHRTQSERDSLIEQYLPLVTHVLKRLEPHISDRLDRDDLHSCGIMGLIDAADRYDPNGGGSFKTYAYTRIRGSILDEIRRHDPLTRTQRRKVKDVEAVEQNLRDDLGRAPLPEELADAADIEMEDLDEILVWARTQVFSADRSVSGEGGETARLVRFLPTDRPGPEEKVLAEERIERLTTLIGELPERERLIIRLYYFEELYLKEIGEILDVSESRVSQLHTRALFRLGQALGIGE